MCVCVRERERECVCFVFLCQCKHKFVGGYKVFITSYEYSISLDLVCMYFNLMYYNTGIDYFMHGRMGHVLWLTTYNLTTRLVSIR